MPGWPRWLLLSVRHPLTTKLCCWLRIPHQHLLLSLPLPRWYSHSVLLRHSPVRPTRITYHITARITGGMTLMPHQHAGTCAKSFILSLPRRQTHRQDRRQRLVGGELQQAACRINLYTRHLSVSQPPRLLPQPASREKVCHSPLTAPLLAKFW